MGGRGSGGRRPGSGSKPDIGLVPPAPPAERQRFAAPEHLSAGERAIWEWLEPLAVIRGTLTADTAAAFELLCRAVALERVIAANDERVGGADHRGVLQRAEALLAKFDLAPNGKPHGQANKPAEQPKSPLELLKARRPLRTA